MEILFHFFLGESKALESFCGAARLCMVKYNNQELAPYQKDQLDFILKVPKETPYNLRLDYNKMTIGNDSVRIEFFNNDQWVTSKRKSNYTDKLFNL
jgi:hypothetical protein